MGFLSSLIQYVIGSPLRNKFTLFFIILAALPVLILGGTSLYLIDLSHRRDVSNLELQLIDQKIEEIRKFFADTLGILELRVGFTQKSEIEHSQQLFLLDGILEEHQAFEEAAFISLAGKETAKRIRGQVKEPELEDVSRLDKFQEALRGKSFIGEVNHTLSGPIVTLAAPVRNRNGDIIQILAAEVNLSQMARLVEASRLGSSGYILLFDRAGVLIAPRQIGNFRGGFDSSRLARVAGIYSGKEYNALGPDDRYKSFFRKTPVVGSGKFISSIGWGLLVEWPIEDADAVIKEIRRQVIQFTIFSILAVLFLAPLFANRLLKPINELGLGAAEIELGNFEKRVEIKTADELEWLGRAFNNMAQGLKRLQELRDEFVFIAAHELRSPVTVIRGYLSMILGGGAGPLDPKMKEYLVETDVANKRLLQLVSDLLEVARSEAGRIVIKVAPLDIRQSIKSALAELKPLVVEKSITVVYDPQPELPNVLADDGRLKEITVNLVGNAIKYNRKGGKIWVSHELSDKEVVTHLKDNGFGISKEGQKKLFEKFFREKTEETKDITGTGLGLFIVKQIVEKMNGRIWAESEEGKGSTFSFSLPIA